MRENTWFRGAHIGIIGRCNFSCLHCYARSGPGLKETLDREQVFRLIADIKRLGVATLYFGGGEPFLHPDLLHMVGRAREAGMLPSISTNGSLLTRKTLLGLVATGFKHNLYVSLDGPNATTNDALRGRGAFSKTALGLKTLCDFEKVQYAVTMVVTRRNLGASRGLAALSRKMGARFVNLCKVEKDGRGIDNADTLYIPDTVFEREVAILKKTYDCIGSYYGRSYLFAMRPHDHASLIQDTSKLDFRQDKVPLGISIHHNGIVQLTPMKTTIGRHDGTKHGLYGMVQKALDDKWVDEQFQTWVQGLSAFQNRRSNKRQETTSTSIGVAGRD